MNHLILSGISFHTTPIAIRERYSIPDSCLKHALAELANMPHIKEAMVLSTCNRTEVYAVASDTHAGLTNIDSFFASTQAIAGHEVLKPDFKLLHEDVALHLFRVASGLDSLVLGEGQIMSQLKAAYQASLTAGTAGTTLDQLCKFALHCGKRVRSETSMGRRAVSLSTAALEQAREQIGSLANKTIMVIGAGRMAQLCIKHLLNEAGSGKIILINRSQQRIDEFLDNKLPNRNRLDTGHSFADRYKLATEADLIIVATEAPEYILTSQGFVNYPLSGSRCIIDISVPRNVDPAIASSAEIKLFNTDDLAAIVNSNLAARESLVEEAEKIIMETLTNYRSWQRSQLVVPTITELRDKIEAIRVEQVEKNTTACALLGGHNSCQYLEEISHALVNQILHHPTVQLKATADYEILRQQAEALRALFDLDLPATAPGARLSKGPVKRSCKKQ